MKSIHTGLGAAILLTQLSFPVHAIVSGVLNGASYQSVVAPNSWAVAFGSGLASTTASATPTASGEWPTTLGGITMQVNGQAAELYYVSPSQINFLIPDGTTFGSLPVVITNVSNGATQSSSVMVQNTAAGLFSSTSNGTGPGAILNGVTYAGPPFLVVTPENGGTDQRTRLAVYCTGLRYAGNLTHDSSVTNVASFVTAQGQDTAGNKYNFTVEYAGAAPGYIGLDQVNIVLPAQLDGAGVVSLTIGADSTVSNIVTFLLGSLPASSVQLTSLVLSSNEVTGGNSVTGTVSLNGRAPATGFPISLRNTIPTLVVPSFVTVPQGQSSATFTITTPVTSSVQTATITATAGSITLSTSLQVDTQVTAQLTNFSLAPTSVQGGATVTGTVGLNNVAPSGGATVQISSDNAAVQPPASVSVAANTNSYSFKIPTSTVTTPQTANLTATLGNNTLTQQVSLVPALQVTLSSTSVTGGGSVTGTVTLGTPPTLAANITLQSSDIAVALITPSVTTIAAGQTSATFTVTTSTVIASRTLTITVSYPSANLSQSVTLTVNPQTAGELQSVAVSPTTVTGGSSATGTITLTGPAATNGLTVQLRSSSIFAAQVPSLLTVPKGQTSATFAITTNSVASTQSVTITATAGNVTQTAVLTVK